MYDGPWQLTCLGSVPHTRVYTRQYIPANTYLGDIVGRRCYAWELEPSPYLFWVDEDLIIDCSEPPHCILAFMREGFYDGLPCNCELVTYIDPCDPSMLHVGIKTLINIYPEHELVYQRAFMMP